MSSGERANCKSAGLTNCGRIICSGVCIRVGVCYTRKSSASAKPLPATSSGSDEGDASDDPDCSNSVLEEDANLSFITVASAWSSLRRGDEAAYKSSLECSDCAPNSEGSQAKRGDGSGLRAGDLVTLPIALPEVTPSPKDGIRIVYPKHSEIPSLLHSTGRNRQHHDQTRHNQGRGNKGHNEDGTARGGEFAADHVVLGFEVAMEA